MERRSFGLEEEGKGYAVYSRGDYRNGEYAKTPWLDVPGDRRGRYCEVMVRRWQSAGMSWLCRQQADCTQGMGRRVLIHSGLWGLKGRWVPYSHRPTFATVGYCLSSQ